LANGTEVYNQWLARRLVMASNLKNQLTGGNRTSIGEAQAVIQDVLMSPNQLKEIYSLFFDDDPGW
jgi:hypothetical protein